MDVSGTLIDLHRHAVTEGTMRPADFDDAMQRLLVDSRALRKHQIAEITEYVNARVGVPPPDTTPHVVDPQ
jgi:hypothetical protein